MSPRDTQSHWKMDIGALSIMIGLAGIAYFGLVAPAVSSREQARARAMELLATQTRARDLDRSLRTATDQLESTRQAIAGSQLKLEPGDERNARLAKLTDLASSNNVQVDSIESGAVTQQPRYSTILIRISGRGTYRSCAELVRQITSTMPDVGVTSIDISGGGGAGGAGDTTATFVLELLWYAQPQPATTKK